jgi:hypothetical protein
MIDNTMHEVTLEEALKVLEKSGGNLQKMAQYFYDCGHSEGEIYMADKINSTEV